MVEVTSIQIDSQGDATVDWVEKRQADGQAHSAGRFSPASPADTTDWREVQGPSLGALGFWALGARGTCSDGCARDLSTFVGALVGRQPQTGHAGPSMST